MFLKMWGFSRVHGFNGSMFVEYTDKYTLFIDFIIVMKFYKLKVNFVFQTLAMMLGVTSPELVK